jgi:hypothetical protein
MSGDEHLRGRAGSPSRPELKGETPVERASHAETQARSDSGPYRSNKSRLWLWCVAACLLQLGAWGAWITIASKHKVQEVPLVQSEHR